MPKEKKRPVRVTNYLGTYIIKEDSSVYTEGKSIIYSSMDGEEKYIGTLVGFITEERFHELYSNAVGVDNLVRDGIVKEPKLGYTMVIKKPEGTLLPDRPIYEVRITKIEYL